MKKVMLHGATNMSNYGDYLFAEFFYRKLIDNGIEPIFYTDRKYGIGEYFSKYLNYKPTGSLSDAYKECDALVFISGGYFVGPSSHAYFDEFKLIARYFKPAFRFMKMNKPIYVLGVGAGPFDSRPYSKKAKKVLNYAAPITVRNIESKRFCEEYGVASSIEVTADTALVVRQYLDKYKTDVPKFEIEAGKKMLLFHIDSNATVKDKFRRIIAPAVKRFLETNTEYRLYLAADGVKDEKLYSDYRQIFADMNPTVLIYDDPWVLTRQIERADLIITTKLHMGIVGSTLGSSVVSFPFIPNKTRRFYNQINESERCVPINEIAEEKVLSMLERYKDKSICVPSDLVKLASRNLELLPSAK